MSIENKYQFKSDIEHVRIRPARYVGSINNQTIKSYIIDDNEKIQRQEVSFNPAVLKCFDEIISNSVDFSKTKEGKHLNRINVEVNMLTGEISVQDNGGIPVLKHKEYGGYIPTMIFSELRSGSNFDDTDESMSTGQNGEGAALVNILSDYFCVETADGKKSFKQEFFDGRQRIENPKIGKSNRKFTKITFIPDYKFFNTIIANEYPKIIKRVYDIAGCNPNLKVSLNDQEINIKSFKDYINMHKSSNIFDENQHWRIGVSQSDRGFCHVSFVNSTETYNGGTHIKYIADQIVSGIREHVKKKHKIDIKPNDVKNHLELFIDCDIVNPRYNSQTKDCLITEPKDYKTSFKVSDKFMSKIIKSDVISTIIDWVEAKARQNDLQEARRQAKNAQSNNYLKKIAKFTDATSKNRKECILFLSEGDCLTENTNVIVYSENGINEVQIKDIKIGDLVLTHNNRLKPVINKFNNVSECIEIETEKGILSCSHQHKWFVYDNNLNSYYFIETSLLDMSKHSLVENLLTGVEYIEPITNIVEGNFIDNGNKYDLKIMFGENEIVYSSNEHNFLIYDYINMSYKIKTANKLTVTCGMVSR